MNPYADFIMNTVMGYVLPTVALITMLALCLMVFKLLLSIVRWK